MSIVTNGPNGKSGGDGILEVNSKTRIRRAPTRAVLEREVMNQIIDECYVCHLGFSDGEEPFVIPTLGWRDGETLYIHGSRGSRLLKVLKAGGSACITFTILDGLVMARSAFHHSANYRSVMVFGRPALVESKSEKLRALEVLMDQIAPGRWAQTRETNDQEIAATDVLSLQLNDVSVKVRAGDPVDDEADLATPIWSGVLPIKQRVGPPIDSQDNQAGQSPEDYSAAFGDRWLNILGA
ncbi:MAG: nitroimidazol reductase NimA-like FMN-containing flavoprotein [Candidatus Azotimanducaceae bacterium]|jgi:nitroimidazol reductase NimA-like FMN-containing flavoprotein (pyridoxamine 5'-phosphate oxidase superfamily)